MICIDSMTRWTRIRTGRARLSWIAAAALAAAVPLAQGCAADPATNPATDDEPTGELVLSLTQPGPHGEIYKLVNATFDITTPFGTFTANGSGPALSVSLPPGLASIFLRPGWTLEKSTDGGVTFQPVSALLGSFNPSGARILANQPAFARFDFLIRDVNGTLQISLGIISEPRELAGGFIVQGASIELEDYALPENRNMDFAVFFQLTSIESTTLADGTKQRVYTANAQAGSFGPVAPPAGAVAAEFYNDNIGILSGPIAADLAGGFLSYTVAAHPDNTITMSGSLIGLSTDIEFAPDGIDAVLPTIGPDGFPDDVFFYDSDAPFTLTSAQGFLQGVLRVRNLVPSP